MFTAFWWYVGIFGTVLEIADFQKFGFFGNRSFFPRCLRFQGFWDPMVCIYNIILLCVYIYICTCRTCIYICMYTYYIYIYVCVRGSQALDHSQLNTFERTQLLLLGPGGAGLEWKAQGDGVIHQCLPPTWWVFNQQTWGYKHGI